MRTLMATWGVLVLFAASSAATKEGIVARVNAAGTDNVSVHYVIALMEQESGHPFNADRIFVRLVGLGGEVTESFATPVSRDEGRYEAGVSLPAGGIDRIEIGVAGEMTYPDGGAKRSDWLIPVAPD